jgi:DNA-binding response OmpR family regulator
MTAPSGMTRRRILVVEDDRDMTFVLTRNLSSEHYDVTVAYDGEEALEIGLKSAFSLILLDVMLPKLDGYKVLHRFRTGGIDAPVLLLTARREERDKIFGFRIGADDYVTKPFAMGELIARVGALIRRAEHGALAPAEPAVPLRAGPIEVDLVNHAVRRDGELIDLSPKAYDLLVALMRRQGAVVTRAELMRSVWGYADNVESRTLDTHIGERRRRLETHPSDPQLVQTVWRVGYRLRDV